MPSDSPLASLRKRKGYSQGDLADAIGISTRHLRRIERGQADLPEYLERHIVHVLQLDKHDLNELLRLPRNERRMVDDIDR